MVRRSLRGRVLALITFVLAPAVCAAQGPVGTISGVVRDPSGSVIQSAAVESVSRTTGQRRSTTTGRRGEYALPVLLAGLYDVTIEAPGFGRAARVVLVEVGATTRVDIVLPVETVNSVVSVEARPLLRHDFAGVSGTITHEQVRGLPLNGRSFLELAKLEPGVQPPSPANRNRMTVPVLGAPAANIGGTRFIIDGGSVTATALGGAQIGVSQEVIQEFQVSTVNFGAASGMADGGAINVVTRGGGNEFRGSAFYVFRDHTLAAYPALVRDPVNPEPFFQRQQFGGVAGGPLVRNGAFFFASWERNDQRAVSATTLLGPDFAHLTRVTPNPLRGDLFSVRFDAKLTGAQTVFVRHLHDGNRAFGPAASVSGGAENAYPSNWNRVETTADQTLLAFTSVLGWALVNDLRLSSFRVRTQSRGPENEDCPGCLGLGAPAITVAQTGLVIGNSTSIDNLGQRFHLVDSLAWQTTNHRLRIGLDWEHNRDRNLLWNHEPVTMTLYSPARVRAYNAQPGLAPEQRIPLPPSFGTLDDILQLPLQTMTVGIGSPGVPQEGGGDTRRWNTAWVYADDVWRAGERVTVTGGVGWGYDGVLNHDLRKPALLEPLLGSNGLGPTRRGWTNITPSAGVIWSATEDGKTLVRAGAGRYFRPHGLTSQVDAERVALGAPGLGRRTVPGSAVANPLSGVPGVPLGAPLDFRQSPTRFTGADLVSSLPAIRAAQSNVQRDVSGVQEIQIAKQQAAANTAVFPEHVRQPSAVHLNVGLERELRPNTVVSADLVYRRFVDVPQNGGAIDLNRYNSVNGPVIRACYEPEFDDPSAVCSRGGINVYVAPYQFTYRGLVVRAQRRLADGWQFRGSYAYSTNSGINAGPGFNLENWAENKGPAPADLTHLLNLSGAVQLPGNIDLALNFAYASARPFTAFLGGVDLNGDGTTNDLLPGTTVNAFNRTLGRDDLARLVAEFNSRNGATGGMPLQVPNDYSFGDDFHSLDVRLSRSFGIAGGVRLVILADGFNIYNASNLTEYSGDLNTPASFGQPGSRVRHVFGSGGARSFQFGVRLEY